MSLTIRTHSLIYKRGNITVTYTSSSENVVIQPQASYQLHKQLLDYLTSKLNYNNSVVRTLVRLRPEYEVTLTIDQLYVLTTLDNVVQTVVDRLIPLWSTNYAGYYRIDDFREEEEMVNDDNFQILAGVVNTMVVEVGLDQQSAFDIIIIILIYELSRSSEREFVERLIRALSVRRSGPDSVAAALDVHSQTLTSSLADITTMLADLDEISIYSIVTFKTHKTYLLGQQDLLANPTLLELNQRFGEGFGQSSFRLVKPWSDDVVTAWLSADPFSQLRTMYPTQQTWLSLFTLLDFMGNTAALFELASRMRIAGYHLILESLPREIRIQLSTS